MRRSELRKLQGLEVASAADKDVQSIRAELDRRAAKLKQKKDVAWGRQVMVGLVTVLPYAVGAALFCTALIQTTGVHAWLVNEWRTLTGELWGLF